MSLRRRLNNLEFRPRFPVPVPRSDAHMERTFQRKLALPLPEASTAAERAECLRLMQESQARLRVDRADTSGLDATRDYALSLHNKYGTDPYWGDKP